MLMSVFERDDKTSTENLSELAERISRYLESTNKYEPNNDRRIATS